MIRSFYIDNFKSLVNFRLPASPNALGPFVCLVGLNGAGKSTVLQAMDFVAHLAQGKVRNWLEQRDWKPSELSSRFLTRKLIKFRLEFDFPLVDPADAGRAIADNAPIVWEASFNPTELRCTSERLTEGGRVLLHSDDQRIVIRKFGEDGRVTERKDIDLASIKFDGSALSLLKPNHVPRAITAVMDAMAAFKSLDMLSPQSMRRRAKEGADLGYGGERLSAYLHGLPREDKARLLATLQAFYPQLTGLSTQSVQAGWKDLRLTEQYVDARGRTVETPARHVNDGLLRVLALLTQVDLANRRSGATAVLFDEVENGINPELVRRLVTHLLGAGPQVFVTTHSPLILNYLPDDVARQAVMLLYRNAQGHTQSTRLFDLPTMQDKLGLLGPGEAYIDTDLNALQVEAQAQAQPEGAV